MKLPAIAVILLALPRVLSPANQNIVDLVLLASLGAIALNLVLGIAGQISIANAAFLAVGGYSAATLGAVHGWPMLPTVLVSGAIGAVVGAAVGLPSLRLRGIYLVVATLSLHYIVIYVVQRYQASKVGPGGFSLPIAKLGPFNFIDYRNWYWLLITAVVLTIVLFKNLMRTAFGRAWLAIRWAEPAAEIIGVNVARYKILAFVLSAFVSSVQGALFAYYNGAVSYETFTFAVAVQYAAMVIIGGLGSTYGPILGAALLTSLPFVMDNAFAGRLGNKQANIQLLIYGLAMIGFLLFAPGGIVEIKNRTWALVRRLAARASRKPPAAAVPAGMSQEPLARSEAMT